MFRCASHPCPLGVMAKAVVSMDRGVPLCTALGPPWWEGGAGVWARGPGLPEAAGRLGHP